MTEVTMAQLGMTEVTDGGPNGGTVQPQTFYIGDNTMAQVFTPLGITNVHDSNMQALWDQVEKALGGGTFVPATDTLKAGDRVRLYQHVGTVDGVDEGWAGVVWDHELDTLHEIQLSMLEIIPA